MKKFAAALLLATALAGCRTTPPSYEHAVELVEKGDLSAARIELMNLLKDQPDNVKAFGLSGDLVSLLKR